MTMKAAYAPCGHERAKRGINFLLFPFIWGILLPHFKIVHALASHCPPVNNFSAPENGVCSSIVIGELCQFRLLDNCKVIEGSLTIKYIDEDENFLQLLKFPDLIEIRDYLLIYKIKTTLSLATMIPNLTIIRGEALIQNFAIVIFSSPGTVVQSKFPSLKLIARGLVFNDASQETFDEPFLECWTEVFYKGTPKYTQVENGSYGELQTLKDCPNDGLDCIEGGCHRQCFGGCSKSNDNTKCTSCRYFNDRSTGACVEKCPENKLKFGHSCVSRSFCKASPEVAPSMGDIPECPHFTYKNSRIGGSVRIVKHCPLKQKYDNEAKACMPCGEGDFNIKTCKDPCDDVKIATVDDSLALRNCNKIKGSLRIEVLGEDFVGYELEKNLENIVEIEGSLRISFISLRSINFLKNLKLIRGKFLFENTTALIVEDCEYLENLDAWMSSLKVENGRIRFKNNDRLCLKTINNFATSCCEITQEDDRRLMSSNNGFRQICNENVHQLIVESTGEVGTVNIILPMVPDLHNDSQLETSSFIVKYKRVDDNNVTRDELYYSCAKGWNVIDIPASSLTESRIYKIQNLLPHTRYAVSALMVNQRGNVKSKEKVIYVRTNTYNPSNVRNVSSTSNSSAVEVRWNPPLYPNGENLFYRVSMEFLTLVSSDTRNFDICQNHEKLRMKLKTIREKIRKKRDEDLLNDHDPLKADMMMLPGLKQKRRNSMTSSCSDETEELDERIGDTTDYLADLFPPKFSPNFKANDLKLLPQLCIKGKCIVPNRRTVMTSSTSYTFGNLKISGPYETSVIACHSKKNCSSEGVSSSISGSSCIMCSHPEITTGEVPWNDEDYQVDETTIHASVVDAVQRGISLSFDQPRILKTSQILGFIATFKRVDGYDVVEKCLSVNHTGKRVYSALYDDLPHGNLSISIRTVTLMSRTESFPIYLHNPFNKKLNWAAYGAIMGIFVTVMAIMTVIFLHMYWKRKTPFHLSGDDIESFVTNSVVSELVRGGKVRTLSEDDFDWQTVAEVDNKGHCGIVSRVRSNDGTWFAIKRPRSSAFHSCFITEVTILEKVCNERIVKGLCNERIVKGFGLIKEKVAYGMEYMPNGNLRKYLQNHRELPIKKLILWAYQINAGMSYLVEKKIIHRDLAARNLLLDDQQDIKIADFGLAIEVNSQDEMTNGITFDTRKDLKSLPIAWMAPECLVDKPTFSQYSDVWSFAVVLGELVTFGRFPFKEDVKQLVKIPEITLKPFNTIMQLCFKPNPRDRPEFHCMEDEWAKYCDKFTDNDVLSSMIKTDRNHGGREFAISGSIPGTSNSSTFSSLQGSAEISFGKFINNGTRQKFSSSQNQIEASSTARDSIASNLSTFDIDMCSTSIKERTSSSAAELKSENIYLNSPCDIWSKSDQNSKSDKKWNNKIYSGSNNYLQTIKVVRLDEKDSVRPDYLDMGGAKQTKLSHTFFGNDTDEDSGHLLSPCQSKEITFPKGPIKPFNSLKKYLGSNNSSPKISSKFSFDSLTRNKNKLQSDAPENVMLLSPQTSPS